MEETKLPTGLEVLNDDCLMYIFKFLPRFSVNYLLINKHMNKIYRMAVIEHKIEIVITKNISQMKFDKLCGFYDYRIKALKIIANTKIHKIILYELISLRLISCYNINILICPKKIQILFIENCQNLHYLGINCEITELYIKDLKSVKLSRIKLNDLSNVKILSCKNVNVSWKGLNKLINLEKLTITKNSEFYNQDIKQLKKLEKLTELKLEECPNITKLCKLKNVKKLTLKKFIIKNVNKLIYLTELIVKTNTISFGVILDGFFKIKQIYTMTDENSFNFELYFEALNIFEQMCT